MRRDFYRILPNFPEKYCKISDLQKSSLCQFGRNDALPQSQTEEKQKAKAVVNNQISDKTSESCS